MTRYFDGHVAPSLPVVPGPETHRGDADRVLGQLRSLLAAIAVDARAEVATGTHRGKLRGKAALDVVGKVRALVDAPGPVGGVGRG